MYCYVNIPLMCCLTKFTPLHNITYLYEYNYIKFV